MTGPEHCSRAVVWKDGEGNAETIRAAGPDGLVDSGTDATKVLQSVVDSLSVTGGRIDVSAGSYRLSGPVRIEDKHSVYVIGEGLGLDAYGDTSGATTLQASGPHNLLEWVGDDVKVRGGGTAFLHLKGTSSTNDAANLYQRGPTDRITHFHTESESAGYGYSSPGGADASHFVNCGFQHNGTGLRLSGGVYPKVIGGEYSDNDRAGISIRGGYDPKLVGTTAVRNSTVGVELRGVRHALLSAVNTNGSDVGISCDRSESGRLSKFVSIDGCAVYDNATGVTVSETEPVLISDSLVHHYGADSDADRTQDTGIAVGTDSSVLVDGCYLSNARTDVDDPNGNVTTGTNLT
jgi:hypothetical protein